jgi:hypothetical protein
MPQVRLKHVTMLHISCLPEGIDSLPDEIEAYVELNEITLDGEVLSTGMTEAGDGYVALLIQGPKDSVPQAFLEWLAEHKDVNDLVSYEIPGHYMMYISSDEKQAQTEG